MTDYPKAVISTSQGDMTVELWNDVAPKHVETFLKLGRSGFYDNLKFHRIVPEFVVQGGCPKGDGTGDPGWSVKAEFNDRPHHPGTLSMARSSDPDSAGSQFFICLDSLPRLDRQYTVFGEVVEGMETVDAIVSRPLNPENIERPLRPIPMTKVYIRTVYRLPFIGEFSF